MPRSFRCAGGVHEEVMPINLLETAFVPPDLQIFGYDILVLVGFTEFRLGSHLVSFYAALRDEAGDDTRESRSIITRATRWGTSNGDQQRKRPAIRFRYCQANGTVSW